MTVRVRSITRAGMIAALYIAVTWIFAPFSFGPLQFRVSEALVLLPILWFEAVPGLWIGCLFGNFFFGGLGPWDIFGGSAVTGAAAYFTWRLRGTRAALLPPIILNAFLVSAYLSPLLQVPYWPTVFFIGLSQSIIIIGPAQIVLAAVRRALQT